MSEYKPLVRPYAWQHASISLNDAKIQEEIEGHSRLGASPWAEIDVKRASHVVTWRVSNYTCAPIPPQLYGQFYNEDVYLVAHVTPKPQKKKKHPPQAAIVVHMWVGKMVSDADYATGVFFLEDLDKRFPDVIIFREVQEQESSAFKHFFNSLTYWNGDFSSGYWMCAIQGQEYRAKLLQLTVNPSSRKVVAQEIPCRRNELDPAYTFALDIGHTVFLWHGNLTPTNDDLDTIKYLETMKTIRGCETKIQPLDDDTDPSQHPFYTYLSKDTYKKGTIKHGDTLKRTTTLNRAEATVDLWRPVVDKKNLSTTAAQFACVKKGRILRKDIDQFPVSLLSSPNEVFICLDKKTSSDIGLRALFRGQEFLRQSQLPLRTLVLLRYKQTHFSLQQYIQK